MVDDLIGKSIGGYDILDVVGRGGMATVYRAQQKSMNRVVAIKVLPEQYINDDTYIQRFNQEVEIVARLEHRNIVPVYDYGEFEGRPYIVMRYMNTGSVDDLLANGPLEIEQIVNIYEQIAPALDYAHSKHVLHRDLKPSNVLLDDDGGAYLTDFGIARVLGEAGNKGITTQGVVGTPSYMSPEQAQGQPLDNRSDIYALGVMLFELATGRRPFESDTPYSIAVMQVTTPPPSPRSLNPAISIAVEEVIYKSLKKKREERYPHAIALSEALKRALNKPVSSIHDTQPGGFQRPMQQPVGGALPIPNASPNPSPQFVPPPPPSSVMQPPARPITPAPSHPRRRKAKPPNVLMSAALGGVIGCGLLAVLVVIALIVVNGLAGRSSTVTNTDIPTIDDNALNAPDVGAAEEGGFIPTLDATSQAAYNALIPGLATPTPGIAPVGVRDDIPLSEAAKSAATGLVYFSERDGNFDLYKLDLSTNTETRLTFDDGVDSYPQVSPDGRSIVFQSDRDGDFDIYTLSINGENLVKLTDNDILDRLPAWSPDGEWIVFSSDTRGDDNFDLYRMRRDGSELSQVFTNGQRNSHPRYSPDGRSIVFTTGEDQDATTWEIGWLDVETGDFRPLKQDNTKDWSPSYSPDGNFILYLTTGPQGRASGQSAIARMNADGSDSRILYDGVGFEWGAAYSPTGTLFAFTTLAPSTSREEVFLMDASGTRIEQLTHDGAQGASWIP
jgi:serine/threonine protein kinase/Tol biopolymer transport system component